MKPRPYQTAALDGILAKILNHNTTLAVLPTGCGKTVIFSEACRLWPEWAVALKLQPRVLVLAHREELVRQAAEKIQAVTGVAPAIEMASDRVAEDVLPDMRSSVVVASVQTLARPGRRAKFQPGAFGLVVVDEAHHAIADSYTGIFRHFGCTVEGPNKLLGVTATPSRADELAMGQVFESVAYEYGINDAIGDGWLVPVRQQAIRVKGLDFSAVRTLAGDLNEKDLEEILVREEPLHAVAAPLIEIARDKLTLVFAAGVHHATMLAQVLNRYKKDSAQALSGATEKEERRKWVERFKAGDLQFLCNCGLFLEGFDAPATAVVVMARPTKSLALYTQVLGRGTRPLPGVVDPWPTAEERRAAIALSEKPWMLALDFVGNSGRHKIVTAQDVLGGKYGSPVRDYARKTAEEESSGEATAEANQVDVEQSLDRAAAELALLNEERERLARIKASAVNYDAERVSPFCTRSAGPTGSELKPERGDPPTDKQIWKLRSLGVPYDTARKYSKRQASAVIDKLLRAKEAAA